MVPDPPNRPAPTLELGGLAMWRNGLKRLKAGHATGLCGVAVAELKQIPDSALHGLVRLFGRVLHAGAFPSHLCRSTVSLVPKVDSPQTVEQRRPITGAPGLCRVYVDPCLRRSSRETRSKWQWKVPFWRRVPSWAFRLILAAFLTQSPELPFCSCLACLEFLFGKISWLGLSDILPLQDTWEFQSPAALGCLKVTPSAS